MVGSDMDAFLGAVRRSPHEVSLLDLFDIARLTETLPTKRALVGIQPDLIKWGMQPTEPVAKALPLAVDEVVRLIQQWDQEASQAAKAIVELADHQTGEKTTFAGVT